jgi:hypothetical protein
MSKKYAICKIAYFFDIISQLWYCVYISSTTGITIGRRPVVFWI